MNDLKVQTCEACRFDAPLVSDNEKAELLPQIPDWEVLVEDGIERLSREFKFENYKRSLEFTNQVAEMAEAEDHHPLIVLEWGRVKVQWWSHKIKGLHRNDFIAAAKTDSFL